MLLTASFRINGAQLAPPRSARGFLLAEGVTSAHNLGQNERCLLGQDGATWNLRLRPARRGGSATPQVPAQMGGRGLSRGERRRRSARRSVTAFGGLQSWSLEA
jgi:hypothetical protein